VKQSLALLVLCALASCGRPAAAATSCAATDERIVVDTVKHTLVLCDKDRARATFNIRLGHGGVGKRREGDGKTPLGVYPLGEPRKSNRFGMFIPIGYPTAEERQRGYTGGDVGVHGPHRWLRWLGSLVNTFDSSDGCIGLATDAEMGQVGDWVRQSHAQTIEIR
jgi:murein L,D-transpeptidase YafK